MKTVVKILLLSFLFVVYFRATVYPNPDFISFQGKWISVDENISLDLDLFQTGDELTGYHCSVTKHAQRIDCALESDDMGYSIEGFIKGNQADITFLSTYCMKYGKAKIVMHEDYIYWEVTEFPDGEFWLPLSAILKRIN